MRMQSIAVAAVAVAMACSMAWADLTPVGSPVFSDSLSQSATGTFGKPYVGHRVVAPAGFNGAYIANLTGAASLVTGRYELRDDFVGGSAWQLVEGWWNLDGSNTFTTTLEIADPPTFPSVTPSDYVGLRVQTALATAAGQYFASREWVFTDGADPSIAGVGLPTGGGSWISWEHGWYLSPLHYDGSAWSGNPIPAPGAVLLGAMGLGMVGWLRRRGRS